MAAGEWGARTPWGLRPPPQTMFASRSCGAAPEAKVAVAVRSASFGGQVRAGRGTCGFCVHQVRSAARTDVFCGLIVVFWGDTKQGFNLCGILALFFIEKYIEKVFHSGMNLKLHYHNFLSYLKFS